MLINFPTPEEIIQAREDEEKRKDVLERTWKLAYKFARRYRGMYNLDFNDLVGEGVKGLIDAIYHYDPSRGAFSTIAAFYIRLRILRYIKKEALWQKKVLPYCWDEDEEEDRKNMQPLEPTDDTEMLIDYVDKLDMSDRTKEIVRLKLQGYSYGEIGKMYGLTRERIRQIVKHTFVKNGLL